MVVMAASGHGEKVRFRSVVSSVVGYRQSCTSTKSKKLTFGKICRLIPTATGIANIVHHNRPTMVNVGELLV